VLEAVQIDVQVVVDREPGEVRDGIGHQLRTAATEAPLERPVDLVPAVPVRDVHPQVPRERQDDRLLEGRVGVHEHDRVGPVGAADVRVGPELVLLILRQPGTRVRAQQEVVARFGRASARGRSRGARGRRSSEGGIRADVPELHPAGRADGTGDADDDGERRRDGHEHADPARGSRT
jgi:hypothetical protein